VRKKYLFIVSGILFLYFFHFGLLLAENKPLWNDEIFSLSNVMGKSYGDMFLGRIEEGNNTPLFYVIQKGIIELLQYERPEAWTKGMGGHADAYSQILLRLSPVFFMSAAIICIFYYFSRFYSLFAGVYSLFISFTSFMVWVYWAEARPYGLWVLLTTLQSLIFLYVFQDKHINSKSWGGLILVHFLLSFTVVFSVAQIFIVSVLLWFYIEKDWKKYIFLTVIPVSIALFYYAHAPRYHFWFGLSPEQLIRDCFSRDRFYILFIFGFFSGLYFLQKKKGSPKFVKNDPLAQGIPYACLTVLMLGAAFLLLMIFQINEVSHDKGFPIASRYFIYLTPISIISTTFLSIHVFKALSVNRWIQIPVTIGMGHLLIHRFFKILPLIKNYCIPIFS